MSLGKLIDILAGLENSDPWVNVTGGRHPFVWNPENQVNYCRLFVLYRHIRDRSNARMFRTKARRACVVSRRRRHTRNPARPFLRPGIRRLPRWTSAKSGPSVPIRNASPPLWAGSSRRKLGRKRQANWTPLRLCRDWTRSMSRWYAISWRESAGRRRISNSYASGAGYCSRALWRRRTSGRSRCMARRSWKNAKAMKFPLRFPERQ